MTVVGMPSEVRRAVLRRNAWVYVRYRLSPPPLQLVTGAEWFVYYTPDHTPPPDAQLFSDPIWIHPEELERLSAAEREYYLGGKAS